MIDFTHIPKKLLQPISKRNASKTINEKKRYLTLLTLYPFHSILQPPLPAFCLFIDFDCRFNFFCLWLFINCIQACIFSNTLSLEKNDFIVSFFTVVESYTTHLTSNYSSRFWICHRRVDDVIKKCKEFTCVWKYCPSSP